MSQQKEVQRNPRSTERSRSCYWHTEKDSPHYSDEYKPVSGKMTSQDLFDVGLRRLIANGELLLLLVLLLHNLHLLFVHPTTMNLEL
jgi:hypothetical protein